MYDACLIYMILQTRLSSLTRSINFFRPGSDDDRIRYIDWYKRTLNCEWKPRLSSEEQKEIKVKNDVYSCHV